MMKRAAYNRKRYRDRADVREAKAEYSQRYHRACMKFREYVVWTRVRLRIRNRRAAIDRLSLRIEKIEKELLKLVDKEKSLRVAWTNVREKASPILTE